MPGSVALPATTVLSFALVLARVGGTVSFVPLPGFRQGPLLARIVLTLTLTLALAPVWPAVPAGRVGIGLFALWLLSDATFGVTVGLAVAFLNEAFVLSSQIFGLQAGYGYASTIDPATQADSSVLQIFSHLSAALLFLAFGLDREVIRIFAASLTQFPPGSFALKLTSAVPILRLGAGMFAVAVRLALPIVAVLMLVDLSLALLGRINTQLQLLMLSFPAKMLISMGLLASIAILMPNLYQASAKPTFQILSEVLHPAP